MISILTILIVTLAIIITIQNSTKDSEKKSDSSLVKPSPTKSQDPSSTLTPTPSLKQNINTSEDNQPTTMPPTSTPTTKPYQQSQTIFDFRYPNSTIISQNGNETVYESSDDPKKITDWYKDKIKSIGMKTTSFVQTSTNGNVLNKLVGANGNKEVRVEISKQNNNPTVKIVVVSN